MNNRSVFNYSLFSAGFRVFFALAGLSALALIAVWNRISNGALHLDNYFNASLWHAHEMLLGYSVAVLAGFLLIPLKQSSSSQILSSDQLASLSLLWLYGRVVPFYSELLPDSLIAVVDWSFLPVLGFYLFKSVLKAGDYQRLIFPSLLVLLALANALIHLQVLQFTQDTASQGLHLAIGVFVMLIVVLASTALPAMIERGLSGVICLRNPVLDSVAIGSGLAVFVCLVFGLDGGLLGIAAVLACVSNGLRLFSWFDRRIWFVPLLWVSFIGYGWLIVGFAMLVVSAFLGLGYGLALHAFTVGGIGVLSLGLMARLALGQTGRVLKVSNMLALVFALINLTVLFRVVLPALMPDWLGTWVFISTYAWLAAFALFVLYFESILTRK